MHRSILTPQVRLGPQVAFKKGLEARKDLPKASAQVVYLLLLLSPVCYFAADCWLLADCMLSMFLLSAV
jgi:hypothetical protein